MDVTTAPAFEAGTPRRLFRLPSPMLGPAQVSSIASGDGQQFLFLVQVPPAQAPVNSGAQK